MVSGSIELTPAHLLAAHGALYRRLVRPGELVFDVGACVGEHAEQFARIGARVIAVEPVAEVAASIELEGVEVVHAACAAAPGELELHVCPRAADLTTADPGWLAAVGPIFFSHLEHDERRTVPAVTLDQLIERFGVPAFVKVDVEGFEDRVLAGLSRPVRTVELETHAAYHAKTLRCLDRLSALGFDRFAFSPGQSAEPGPWTDAATCARQAAGEPWGDVYATAPV